MPRVDDGGELAVVAPPAAPAPTPAAPAVPPAAPPAVPPAVPPAPILFVASAYVGDLGLPAGPGSPTPAAPAPGQAGSTAGPLSGVTTGGGWDPAIAAAVAHRAETIPGSVSDGTIRSLIDNGWLPTDFTPPPPLEPAGGGRLPEAAVFGPFAGIGAFASDAPLNALAHAALLDWIALKADGADRSPPSAADTLRGAGLRVLVWESDPNEGQAAVDRYGAAGYIGQAEGPSQLAGALAQAAGLQVPKALVTNLFMGSFPAGWVCLPECYDGAGNLVSVPLAVVTARNKGAAVVAPVVPTFGPGTLAGSRAGLADAGSRSFSFFRLETASGADWTTLAAIEQAAAAPAGGGAGGTAGAGGTGGAGGTIPGTGGAPGVTPVAQPTGPKAAWRALMGTLGSSLPGAGVYLRNVGRSLPGV